jgi:hypothetical protein
MTRLSTIVPPHQEQHHRPSLPRFCIEVFGGILLCVAFALGVYFSLEALQPERHANIELAPFL